jgi:hypothetical protein
MGYHGLHKNKMTDEVLAQDVQVCPVCYKNFSSDDAWEKHWDRKKPRGIQCQTPEEVGLISFRNARGATIYRVKKPPFRN